MAEDKEMKTWMKWTSAGAVALCFSAAPSATRPPTSWRSRRRTRWQALITVPFGQLGLGPRRRRQHRDAGERPAGLAVRRHQEHERHPPRHHAPDIPARIGRGPDQRSGRHRHHRLLLARHRRPPHLGRGPGLPAAHRDGRRARLREARRRPFRCRAGAAGKVDDRHPRQPRLVGERHPGPQGRQLNVRGAVRHLQPRKRARGKREHGGQRQLGSGPGLDRSTALPPEEGRDARQAAGQLHHRRRANGREP